MTIFEQNLEREIRVLKPVKNRNMFYFIHFIFKITFTL